MSGNMYDPDWLDLCARLERAEKELRRLRMVAISDGRTYDARRLDAKTQGVALARSYVEEYMR